MSCRGDHCHDGGQLCKERRLSSAAQRVPSLCFTAPLSHIVPFRAQTVHPPCSGHPTIVRASWFEKPSGFFFFYFFFQVKAICICFSLWDLTGRLRQADIEHAKGGFPLHHHLNHPLVFFVLATFLLWFPKFPQLIAAVFSFWLKNTDDPKLQWAFCLDASNSQR